MCRIKERGARGTRGGRAPTLSFSVSNLASPKAPTTTAMTRTVKTRTRTRSRDCARSADSSARASPSTGARPARGRPLVASPPRRRRRRRPPRRPRGCSPARRLHSSSRRGAPGRVSPPYSLPRAPWCEDVGTRRKSHCFRCSGAATKRREWSPHRNDRDGDRNSSFKMNFDKGTLKAISLFIGAV